MTNPNTDKEDKVHVSFARSNGVRESHTLTNTECREMWERFKNTPVGHTMIFTEVSS